MDAKELIARRVARDFRDGFVVNLGIGVPTLAARYVAPGINVILQSENGFVGLTDLQGEPDKDLTNAGGMPVGIMPGGAFFDSAMSFAIIRSGRVDATVLGGLEVDQEGNLANWMVPGKTVPGMGGAMDLVTGAKQVIVAMEHRNKQGASKVLRRCTLPLTGKGVVTTIVTELAYIKVTPLGLVLHEVAPGVSVPDVLRATEADLIIAPDVKPMDLGLEAFADEPAPAPSLRLELVNA